MIRRFVRYIFFTLGTACSFSSVLASDQLEYTYSNGNKIVFTLSNFRPNLPDKVELVQADGSRRDLFEGRLLLVPVNHRKSVLNRESFPLTQMAQAKDTGTFLAALSEGDKIEVLWFGSEGNARRITTLLFGPQFSDMNATFHKADGKWYALLTSPIPTPPDIPADNALVKASFVRLSDGMAIHFDPLPDTLIVPRQNPSLTVRNKLKLEVPGLGDIEIDLNSFSAQQNFSSPKMPPRSGAPSKRSPVAESPRTLKKPFGLLPGPKPDETSSTEPAKTPNLDDFETRMRKEIIGQDEIIKNISEAILAHQGNPLESNKPVSFFVVGTPSAGKTEIGHALARSLYGPKSEAAVVNLGDIQTEQQLSTLFGSGKGYVGSTTPGKLEEALKSILDSEGVPRGVIIMDEASDIGSGSKDPLEFRRSAFVKFNEMLEEGRFVSFANAKGEQVVYDLRNVTFEFTGNGLQKLFQGTASEDRRMDIYNAHKDKESLQRMLRDDGASESFLKRLNGIFLAKPLTTPEAAEVALSKFIQPTLKAFQDKYKMKITHDGDFGNKLADSFYSTAEGVRGLRNLVDNALVAMLVRTTMDHEKNKKSLKDGVFSIELEEKMNNGKLAFNLVLKKDGTTVEAKDVSNYATVEKLLGFNSKNPLENPVLVNRVQSLKKKMEERVLGQPELLEAYADAVKPYFILPGVQRKPITMFLVGSTGTGKTESAKALAHAMFDSSGDRFYQAIALGNVETHGDLYNIIGSPAGHSGSEIQGQLEVALSKMPNGGVIVFDEASNMGGANQAEKNALFKKFYDLIETGRFKSTATGIEYDLSNYVFVFTGNDGENLFKGLSADDMRLSIFEEMRDPSKLHKMLLEAGLPEAFLGRMDRVILQRPLTENIVTQILETKFIRPYLNEFKKRYPKLTIEYDPAFLKTFAHTFFSHGKGARSIRAIVEQQLGSSISEVLMKHVDDPKAASELKLKLELIDTLGDKTFRNSKDPPREVSLRVRYDWKGEPKTYQQDLTLLAPEVTRLNKHDTWSVALHEAGHAVVNNPKLTGQSLGHVTIRAADHYLGYARYDSFPEAHTATRESVIAKTARLMAGQMASMMDTYDKDQGWSDDLKRIRLLAQDYLLRSGMEGDFVAVSVDKEGNPILDAEQSKHFKREFEKIFAEAFSQAKVILERDWRFIRYVAHELLKNGSITGKKFEQMKTDFQNLSEKRRRAGKFRSLRLDDLIKVSDPRLLNSSSDALDRLPGNICGGSSSFPRTME